MQALSSHLNRDELLALGFQQVGNHVRVSRKASFHQMSGTLGDHTRIDDFSVLTGAVHLGRYVHIAPFCFLGASAAPITLRDGSGLSSHCALYTASDSYQSNDLSNPTVPASLRHLTSGPITLGLGVIVGAHSTLLPNVTVGDAASIGAHCLVYRNIPEGAICVSGGRKIEITGQRDATKIRAALSRLA